MAQEVDDYFAYLSGADVLPYDAGYTEATHLYRYFTGAGRLLYAGVSSQPSTRHWNHCGQLWWPHSFFIRYELFPTRSLALIAETICIEDEKPDYNCHVRLQSRKWPLAAKWYEKKTGGRFVGEDVAWFAIEDDGYIGRRVGPPDWWSDPFTQEPLRQEDDLRYQKAREAARIMEAYYAMHNPSPPP